MTHQKSEDPIKPEGLGNLAPTQDEKSLGGGEEIPVKKQVTQLGLPFAAAADPEKGANCAENMDLSMSPGAEVSKADDKNENGAPATIEGMTARLTEALKSVAANRGAPGPDGKTISVVREHWADIKPKLEWDLLEGSYQPGAVRQALIPKGIKGWRKLGIPNVIDRLVQEAVRREIEPHFEPHFHPSSHGFRPGRSCHSAIYEAKQHLIDGTEWVVDLDMEKFFDRVHHQRLMSRIAARVKDKRLLVLIGRMLKAGVVMPDGVVVIQEEGVPQGGPLSPLLSNIVLDELDHELEQRGHRFVRYADDINIFVRSKRAGERVMASTTHFIEKRLRLKVNASKSAVAKPDTRHFLGFRLRQKPGNGPTEILFSKRTLKRMAKRIQELTPRNWGQSLDDCIAGVNAYNRGWVGFFGVCSTTEKWILRTMDAHIRRRLRAIQLKHWKSNRIIVRHLIALGANPNVARRRIHRSKKSAWAMSRDYIVEQVLQNSFFEKRGLVSLAGTYTEMRKGHRRSHLMSNLGGNNLRP